MARRRVLSVLIVIVCVVGTLGLAEVLLRAVGRGPWQPFPALAHVPRMTTEDAELGWRNAPGTYTWSPSGSGEDEVTMTLDGQGRRESGGGGAGRRISLYGGSFILGFGVDDTEHVGARLAAERPDLSVENRGVPGFGTLQAARLHASLRAKEPAEDIVIYGLVELHDARNVALRSWLAALERAGGHHPTIGVPWVVWDGTALREHPPARYRHWSISETSALVYLVERMTIGVLDRGLNTKTETTVQLIARWRDQARPSRFVVALLDAPHRERAYRTRLAEEGVEVVDLRGCGYPEQRVPVDGHPAPSVHACWAERLAEALP